MITYWEDFCCRTPAGTIKGLGCLLISDPGIRKLGSAGMQEKTITSNLVLQRGSKEIVVEASEKKPLKVISTITKVGPVSWVHPLDL